MDPECRIEDEGPRQIGPMFVVGQLEEVELLCDAPVLVGEEREGGADARSEGAVHVGPVDSDRRELPVLALDLVLHPHEVPYADLLLRAPPAAHEAEHERLGLRDLTQ
jgi:hypothetical protein